MEPLQSAEWVIQQTPIDYPEWQLIDENQWVFGHKVRGLVRERLAEVYYDEQKDPSWIWMCQGARTEEGQMTRGRANSLVFAVESAEEVLGIK